MFMQKLDLPFLKFEPTATNLYKIHRKRHLKNLLCTLEHASQEALRQIDVPAVAHILIPSWKLGFGL